MPCPYTVLGVPRNCTVKEVNSAWRKLSLLCHPDRLKEGDASLQRQYTIRFQSITEAKNELLAKLPPDEASRTSRTRVAPKPRGPVWQRPSAPTAPPAAKVGVPQPKYSASASSASNMPSFRPTVPTRPKEAVPTRPHVPPQPWQQQSWQRSDKSNVDKSMPPPRARNQQETRPNDTRGDGAEKGTVPKARQPQTAGTNGNTKPAYDLLPPDREPFSAEDGNRFRIPPRPKPAGPPGWYPNQAGFRKMEEPRRGPGEGPVGNHQYRNPMHFNSSSDTDSDSFTDGDDMPESTQPHRANGIPATVMDLLDDDLAMPAPTRRRAAAFDPNARTVPPQQPPRRPQKEIPTARPGGIILLNRKSTRAFAQFLHESMGRGKHAFAQKKAAAQAREQQQNEARQAQEAQEAQAAQAAQAAQEAKRAELVSKVSKDMGLGDIAAGEASSSKVSDDTSDTSSLNSTFSRKWRPTEADRCEPTQQAFDMFSDSASSGATKKDEIGEEPVVDVDDTQEPEDSPVVIVASQDDVVPPPKIAPTNIAASSDIPPAVAASAASVAASAAARARNAAKLPHRTRVEVDISDNSDANSTSSGTSPSSVRPRRAAAAASVRRAPPHPTPVPTPGAASSAPPVPARKRKAPPPPPDPENPNRSPKSVASSSGSKRQKTSSEEVAVHSLPVRIRLGYLMERFSLEKEDADVVHRAIVSLRAKGKSACLRVSKIFDGYDPRKVDILKSLPIFHVTLAPSKKSNKQVHRVCLTQEKATHDANTSDKKMERMRSLVSVSSDEDNDDLGKILRKSCQQVLPWTYKADGHQIWDDTQ